MAGPLRSVVGGVCVLAVLTSCGGSADPVARSASPTPSPTGVACPEPPPTTIAQWPAGVPSDFPKPPGAKITSVESGGAGVTTVKISTALSLQAGKAFVVGQLPATGFLIVGGDSEPHEADIPFARDRLLGHLRLALVDECHTDWLLFISVPSASGARPTLPSLPGPSASAG